MTYPRTDAFAYRVLHINLLKEWYPQMQSIVVNLIRLVENEEEEDEQYLPGSQSSSTLELNHLSIEQKVQIQRLCDPTLFRSQ